MELDLAKLESDYAKAHAEYKAAAKRGPGTNEKAAAYQKSRALESQAMKRFKATFQDGKNVSGSAKAI